MHCKSWSARRSREGPASLATHGSDNKTPSRRVLIVDDSRDARTILQILIGKLGHEVKTAADGSSALVLLKEFRPDVVFCDILLGGPISGYAFAQAVREQADLHPLLIAMSGWDRSEYKEQAFAAGFDRVLQKPVALQELQDELRLATECNDDDRGDMDPANLS